MASRRQSLRSRVSMSVLEQEVHLDEEPKTQSPIDALQYIPLTRSMSKKVEETPSQTSRHNNGTPMTPSAVGIQEMPIRQLRHRLVSIPLCENMKEAEKTTSGRPQLGEETPKSPQKRDSSGRWLSKVNSHEELPWKGKVARQSAGKQDADIKFNAHDENSLIQHIDSPDAELERVKELQMPLRRKSLRIASQQSRLENSYTTISIERICLGHNGSQPEEHVDTSCDTDVAEQSEMQTPNLNRRTKEVCETREVKQEKVEMDKEEVRVSGQSPCVTAVSSLLEQGPMSAEDACRSRTQSGSNSVDSIGSEPKPNLSDKEVQTETWKIIVETEEEFKTEDLEMEERMFVEDASPKESRDDAVKETPPIKQAHWNLRNGSSKLGTIQSEVDIEEEVNAEFSIVGEEKTSEMTKTQEMAKAEVLEADKKVDGVNGQAEAIAAKLGQEAEEQNMGISEKKPTSALQLIVSNLDSSKDFGELQIAVISFFMQRKLSVTSISIKKSRKRGHVTFLSGKDLNRAMKYNGEQLLGRTLRLRRPQQIWKPVAKVVQGKKRKLKEYDGESMTPSPAKKKIVQRASISTKKDKKAPVSLLKKKKKKLEQTEKTEEEEEANPVQKKKKRNREIVVLSGKSKKDEWEDTAVVLQKKKKKSLEKPVLCEKREGNAALPPQKKKKKHQEKKVSLSKERVEEGEKVASVLQKKKKKNKETLVLSEKRAGKEELTACPKKKKKKMQKITSWCLYMQKVESQERVSELKTAIGNFLNERSVAYKEIVLYPDSCSACVELYSEHDLNEALEFDACKIFGQAARLSKVEKLGALGDGDDPRTLYVKSLPSEVCAKDLKSLFQKVTGVWIQDRQEINKRFAFVTFETTEAAANALSKGEIECKGKLLQLKHAGQRNKGKRKIVMVRNLLCPMSKKYLKSLFNDAVDIQLSKDNQSQGIAYIEYRTAKQAKVALKAFRDKGVPGHAIRIASIEERKESPKSKSDDSVPISSLFIWGLSNKTTVKMLRSTFKGAVNARLPQSPGKRFAFIDFKTAEEAARTREEMQNVQIDGHKVKLYFANSAQQREEAVHLNRAGPRAMRKGRK